MVRCAALASMVLLLLSTASVSAGVPQTVEMKNNFFDPAVVKIPVGDSVTWHNGSGQMHTTTADLFGRWSVTLNNNAQVALAFDHAGTWAYHCEIHEGMRGKVKTRPSITPAAGNTSTVFEVRVAWLNADAGFIHDIQRRKLGKTFRTVTSTTGQTIPWTFSNPGTYQFRARYRKTSGNGAATGWSQPVTVVVN